MQIGMLIIFRKTFPFFERAGELSKRVTVFTRWSHKSSRRRHRFKQLKEDDTYLVGILEQKDELSNE